MAGVRSISSGLLLVQYCLIHLLLPDFSDNSPAVDWLKSQLSFLGHFDTWATLNSCNATCAQEAADLLREIQKDGPDRLLTKEEVQHFHDYGVVLLRGVLKNKELLARLAGHVQQVADMRSGGHDKVHCYKWNPGCRALWESKLSLRIAASAVPGIDPDPPADDEPHIEYDETPVFGGNLAKDRNPTTAPASWLLVDDDRNDTNDGGLLQYHFDTSHPLVRWPAQGVGYLVTLHMAVVDSAAPLEFVAGSSRIRHQIKHSNCTIWYKCFPCNHGMGLTYQQVPRPCLEQVQSENSDILNVTRFRRSMKAGDAFLFDGNTMHRGLAMNPREPRLAMAFRHTIQEGSNGMNGEVEDLNWLPRGAIPLPE